MNPETRFASLPGLVLGLFLALGAAGAQAQNAEKKSTSDLMKAFEAMSQEMERLQSGQTDPLPDIVMIEAPGEYPPGRYIGRCEAKRKPDNPTIGDRFEVRYIESSFFRREENGNWNGVGSSSPDIGVKQHSCTASEADVEHAHFLGGPGSGNLRGPGQYKLRVSGYGEWYEVRRCPTVGGGPCPERVSREEIDYEIPFEILPQ
jgi:hypothetical protein